MELNNMKRIIYDKPTNISEIISHKGELKVYFGRGICAGEIKCTHCYSLVGNLTQLNPESVVGWIKQECEQCNKKLDYSMVNTLTLHYNLIPHWICHSTHDRGEQLKLCREEKDKYFNDLMEYYDDRYREFIPLCEIQAFKEVNKQ